MSFNTSWDDCSVNAFQFFFVASNEHFNELVGLVKGFNNSLEKNLYQVNKWAKYLTLNTVLVGTIVSFYGTDDLCQKKDNNSHELY